MPPTVHLGLLAATSLVLAAACASHHRPSAQPAGRDAGEVVHLVDGDTLDVRIEGRTERVRLIGVDTPESVDPDRPVQCYGAEASSFLATLVPEGTPVRLERDAIARDDYGRLLAYLYRVADDLLVNLAIVEQGYADAVTYGDNEALFGTFATAEADARAAGRGLWGACGGADVDLSAGPAGSGAPAAQPGEPSGASGGR